MNKKRLSDNKKNLLCATAFAAVATLMTHYSDADLSLKDKIVFPIGCTLIGYTTRYRLGLEKK